MLILCLSSIMGLSAATDTLSVDTISMSSERHASYEYCWHPDPIKSVWLGAIFPGLGQIYNRSYWKLPIVYGGLMGCGYAIGQNHQKYIEFKEAYRDIITDAGNLSNDPKKSYNALMPNGYTLERLGGESGWKNTLNSRQNTYRRYRDISIVASIVVYALTLIDAYVDAQLFDFDISEDLSLDIAPQVYYDAQYHNRITEMKLAISF